jgi:hypothetical protein
MAKYVQGPGSDNWHWCRSCSNYPSTIAKSRDTRPTSGDLCNQCKSKENAGTCRT